MKTIPQMATPDRFTGARLPRGGESLWIVHGVGVGDLLVGEDLRARPVEEMLWEILHADGYERIAFTSYRESVYFRDPASRNLTRRNSEAPAPRPREMRRFSGPQGRRMLLQPRGEAPAQRPASVSDARFTPRTQTEAASDTERLRMLESLMAKDDVRTAVVVPAAETFLRNMQNDMRRPFAELLSRWSLGQVGARNTCVLLFSQPDLAGVIDLVRDLRYLPQLADRLTEISARTTATPIGAIGHADEAELARLVHIVRLRHGLEIADWRSLSHLTRVMAAQHLPVRRWLPALQTLADRNRPLSEAELRADGLVEIEVPASENLWARLDRMVGLQPVKDFLAEHRHMLEAEAALREHGQESEPVAMHLMFTGNPGTGKTVIAGVVGELYRDLGLLRRGHVVNASVDDLISPNVGETARVTTARIREALDGVLFIDEAYRLSDQAGGFGGEAIDALLTEMENNRDRLVVIIAGYPDKMTEFLAANPGLPSRFPAGNRIRFPDYEPAELHAIVTQRLEEAGLTCAPDLSAALRKVTESLYRTRGETFGNARTMRELAHDVKRRWALRTRPSPGDRLEPATAADVPPHYRTFLTEAAPLDEVLAELDGMIGLQEIKTSIRQMAAVLELRKLQPKRNSTVVAPHMLFVGSPGTGKTTVAQLIGRVFVSLGLLVKGHVVATTRSDLVAEYVGQTGPRTRAKAMEALDGVLLIDEAYELARGGMNDFGSEAITELVALMEQWRGRLVVVAAGYPDAMEAFVRDNDGLASRFTERIHFTDYSVPELRQIFEQMAASEGYQLGQGAASRAVRWFEARRELDGQRFGNARTVRGLLGRVEQRLAVRVQRLPSAERLAASTLITSQDIPDPEAT